MRYSIKLRRDWQTPVVNGKSWIFKAGQEIRVPKDMDPKFAERALASGVAVKVMPQRETKKRANSKNR